VSDAIARTEALIGRLPVSSSLGAFLPQINRHATGGICAAAQHFPAN
jgi:hypothetical protein